MLRKACTNNNMVAALGLLVLIILGQTTLFDLLIDTIPGRIVMIALILGISYMNNNLGVVAVLLIIIMFNQSEIALFEGLTNSDQGDNRNSKIPHRKDKVTKVTEDSHKNILLMDEKGNIKASVPNPLDRNGKRKHKSNSGSSKPNNSSSNNSTATDSTTTDSTPTDSTDTDTTAEGFDNMLDMEDSIKRGKPSDALSTQVPDPRKIDTSGVQGYSGFSTSTYSSM
ncbi:MAG: hypothetical protein CMC04_05060 [Flavobacteriaceae bacterium]|nr:hypothetical protein [Flavobacteriaceae bacterium]